ncbi:MAG TPA: GAF domain-containing protein [Lapillicoccus sp.]|nr:GAF domain-containing protein [Lapillicoccus sp.]
MASTNQPPRVSSQVLASWRRSEGYGVSLEVVDPVFTGSFDQESLFFQCGHQVLTDLHATLAAEPISLMLTDADGLVLNRLSGDTSLLRALDDVHLAPGFSYAEREAGTNGLGLALADRAPTLVRADEHYSASLCTYTCAAAPVLDPMTGRLEGAVNITTWSSSSNDLLLALAQSAASNTSALMLARSTGRRPRPAPTGQVFRVEPARLEPGAGTLTALSAAWTDAVDEAATAMSAGRHVAAVGEPESGRSTLLAQAARRVWGRDRILSARAPRPTDVEAWMSLWSPELGKPHTVVLVGEVDTLPAWAVERLRDLVTAQGHPPVSVTAQGVGSLPRMLDDLVGAVVWVPPLRDRPADVMPLARYAAARVRGRDVDFTAAAEHALQSCGWPGNVGQLTRVVREAAARAEVVDARHLPAEVLSGSPRRLTRIEAFERDEIVRCLSMPGATVTSAAGELGMSRATIYRKIAQYDIHAQR